MTAEEIVTYLNSADARYAWQMWWADLDARLARGSTPPTQEETEAAVQRLADALDIDFGLAKGLVMYELRPDLYAAYIRRRHAN
jgi:hypothetical protein